MTAPMFDPARAALNRRRASTDSGDYFLHARAIDDLVDRLAPFAGDVVAVGIPVPLRPLLAPLAPSVVFADTLLAIDAAPGSLAAILAIGALDTAEPLAPIVQALAHLLVPGGTLAGTVVGSASLPRLRAALVDAERAEGRAVQRFHPMLDGSSLAGLLQGAGLADPWVETDRVTVTYASLERLVGDLRAMGCTRALTAPAPAISRAALVHARRHFMAGDHRAAEQFELLHFTARAPTR